IAAPPRSGDVDATQNVVAPNADPRTRITADPDGLASGVTGGFNRVADHWPARVELSAETGPRAFLLMILNPIDRDQRRADLFMTYTNDTLTYDLARVYLGTCDFTETIVTVANASPGR
ncbi:MAG: hypothetical protein ACRC1J_12705, partial [Sandaracinobacteroides sp.]